MTTKVPKRAVSISADATYIKADVGYGRRIRRICLSLTVSEDGITEVLTGLAYENKFSALALPCEWVLKA